MLILLDNMCNVGFVRFAPNTSNYHHFCSLCVYIHNKIIVDGVMDDIVGGCYTIRPFIIIEPIIINNPVQI